MSTQSNKEKLNSLLKGQLDVYETIQMVLKRLRGKSIFSTSFSKEDQIIYDCISRQKLPIEVFTLDTGRMFQETYNVWSRTLDKYNTPIKTYYPNTHKVELMLESSGPNLFYRSVELRESCCHVRKVEPLGRALKGYDIWFTGIRAAHSEYRSSLEMVEWDEGRKLYKVHPLLYWTDEQVEAYIETHSIPYNVLYDKGFLSIGCSPCTRAISPGESLRAGRWWWEDTSKKECGLHK